MSAGCTKNDKRQATSDKIDETNIEEKLRSVLSEENFKHALRTRAKAEKLARAYGVDVEKARLAGLLHDYGRSLSHPELLAQAHQMGICLNEVELQNPALLHGQVGAKMVLEHFHLTDQVVLQSIALHTLGSPRMTPLDKVIYLADKLESGREHEGVAHLRAMIGRVSLDELFREAYFHSIVYVLKRRGMLHPSSVEVWNLIVTQ